MSDSILWTPHLTVATIVEREGRFLMVEEYAEGQLVYNQPAGHLDDREAIPAAAIRETLEETAWEVTLDALVGIYHWRHPDNIMTFVRFCFAATGRQHDPHRALDTGIQRAVWLSRAEIAALGERLRSPMVLRCIDDYLAGHRYPLHLVTRL
jgi:8-oxo-dGTP pyrophosphatase MutT (NUDIX family)